MVEDIFTQSPPGPPTNTTTTRKKSSYGPDKQQNMLKSRLLFKKNTNSSYGPDKQ